MLSAAITLELERALAGRFEGAAVATVRAVGGGCISPTLEVRLQQGASVFVKLAPASPPGDALLAAEVAGLAALRSAGAVRVPDVLARGVGWVALEWLPPGDGGPAAWERLGRGLAELHGAGSPRRTELGAAGTAADSSPGPASFGWERDNFIGTLPQANGPVTGWAEFWRSRRLEPQLERAASAGLLSREEVRSFGPLLAALPALLAVGQGEGPSLLHGDLWSGNVHPTRGEAALVDPACYRGHREVDLAMAALFGGFPPGFYHAYREAWPLADEELERRRAAYQLYYLLVHVNLFGRGYAGGTMAALQRALGR